MRSDVSRTIIQGHNGQPVFATIGLAEPKLAQPAKAGGARRDRTDDLMLAKHALSQLSYGPMSRDGRPVFAQAGFAGHASLRLAWLRHA